MTTDIKNETPQRVGPLAPLFGEFVRAGTMNVSGEETIGCAIAMTEESLRSAPRLPFYRRVAIIPAEDYGELERENARLRGEVAQLEKNCTQIHDAMKKVEAEAKFFQTLVQSHRSLSSPNVADHARPLGAVACRRLFEEPAGKTSVNSKLQKSAEERLTRLHQNAE